MLTFYTDLSYREGLYDNYMISVTVEILLYNENYQMGTHTILEFLVNNPGSVIKHYTTRSFFGSRYDPNYHRTTEFTKGILIFFDVIYWLGLIWLAYKSFKLAYRIIYIKIRYKQFIMYFSDFIDISVSILSFTCVVYRFIICKFITYLIPPNL